MFDSLGGRRPRRRVPGWLLLTLFGLLAGAGGVIFVQERYLPPRLSAAESASLRRVFEQADGQRGQLKAELAQLRQQLLSLEAERRQLEQQLAASKAVAERLRDDLALTVQSLPPDPRGGSVEVRAGQFSARPGALDYLLVLTRDGSPRKSLSGVVRFTVSGDAAQGGPGTVAPQPIALSMLGHEVVRGSLPLPEGFRPVQTTVQVLDQAAGKPLGMRVLRVR
jgi:hypothetical protein